jgi:RNA polymerase sigma-54 factor
MRLGYDLTIEQSQKLVMTPELIQAIQILQFNTQELENYVEEQLLCNPILNYRILRPRKTRTKKRVMNFRPKLKTSSQARNSKRTTIFETKENNEYRLGRAFKEKEYDDISYKQWEYNTEKNEYTYEQFVSRRSR